MNNDSVYEILNKQKDQITELVRQNQLLTEDSKFWKHRALRFESLYHQLLQTEISDRDLDDGK